MASLGDFLGKYWWDFAVLFGGLSITMFLCWKYKSTKYVSFITYIPNIWTSLGILGTFLSIYWSLNNLNFKTVLDISKLIEMIAPAFSTSIIGIIGALVSSMAIRVHRASLEVKSDQSYEASIKNIERQVNVMGSGAKEMAREMGREVVASAGEGLKTAMLQHMRSMVAALNKEEKKFNEVSDEIIASLRAVSSAHNESMKGLLEQYKSEAADVKRQCVTAIKDMKSEMCVEVERISQEHTKQINEVAEKQIAHLESIDGAIKYSVEGAYVRLAAGVEAASNQLEGVAGLLPGLRNDFEDTGKAVKSAVESFAQVKTDLEKVRNELKAVVDENARRMESVGSFVDKTFKQNSENATQTDALIRRASVAVTNMENAADRMLNAADRVIKAYVAKPVVMPKPVSASPKNITPKTITDTSIAKPQPVKKTEQKQEDILTHKLEKPKKGLWYSIFNKK